MIKEGRSYSILTDQLGTPTEAYDAEGNEVWSRVLDMDGNVIEETGNKGMVPFLFQGQYYDRETGLAYNRFRYYSPKMGMYVSQDPIGLDGGILNLYGYVSDTNTWLDLFGLARSKYATKTTKQVAMMRKRFNRSGRKKFLKRLGKNETLLKDRGFSDEEIKIIQSGQVPTGYEVHHKIPLFRGGNNSYSNLDLMKSSEHKKNFKILHYYEGETSPYYI